MIQLQPDLLVDDGSPVIRKKPACSGHTDMNSMASPAKGGRGSSTSSKRTAQEAQLDDQHDSISSAEDEGNMEDPEKAHVKSAIFLPDGPKTFMETFAFAEENIKRIRAVAESGLGLACLDRKRLVLTSSYSGVGTAEWAMRFVVAALNSSGLGQLQVRFYSVADSSPQCRKVLMQFQPPPEHVFGDLKRRMPEGFVEWMHEQQEAMRDQYRASPRSTEDITTCSDGFFDFGMQQDQLVAAG